MRYGHRSTTDAPIHPCLQVQTVPFPRELIRVGIPRLLLVSSAPRREHTCIGSRKLRPFLYWEWGSTITRVGEDTSKSSPTKTGTTRRHRSPSQAISIQNDPHALAHSLPLLPFIPKRSTAQSVIVNTPGQVAAAELGSSVRW